MISKSFIITGPRRAGKSTLCWRLLGYFRKQATMTIGGVITLQNHKKYFYLISEDVKIPFEANNNEEFVKIGHYKIHKTNLKLAINSIQKSLRSDFLFIDEIGILELQEKGYYPVLETVISRDKSNILVVRESILDEFIALYPQLSEYEVVNVVDQEISIPFNIIKNYINQLAKYY